MGLPFHGETKELVAQKLKQMEGLDHFDQLLQIDRIFSKYWPVQKNERF